MVLSGKDDSIRDSQGIANEHKLTQCSWFDVVPKETTVQHLEKGGGEASKDSDCMLAA